MPEHRSGGWTQRLRSIYSHHYKKLTYIAVCQDIWNLTMNGTRKKKERHPKMPFLEWFT